ncbi:MAG: hypothetical protein Q9227_001978 [Pyrenula ochraceoflavens]
MTMILLLISIPHFTVSLKVGSYGIGRAQASSRPTDQSLKDLLQTHVNDSTYQSALKFLSDMETLPTCHRTATSHLIISCQEVDGHGRHGSRYDSVKLDLLRDIYAARLALCELERAGTSLPSNCSGVTQFSVSGHLESASVNGDVIAALDALRQAYLTPCTQALYGNQQQWTSYSNSHQNAVVTCQAARIDVEKDMMVKVAKNLTRNTEYVDQVLMEAAHRHKSQLDDHLAFAKSVASFHQQLLTDLDAARGGLKFGIAEIVAEVGRDFREKAQNLMSSVTSAESGLLHLGENLEKALAGVHNLTLLQQKMRQDAYSERARMASVEKAHHETTQELATRTRQTLEGVNNGDMTALILALSSVSDQTSKLGNIVAALISNHTHLGRSIQATNTQVQQYFSENESKLRAIDANLTLHLQQQEVMNTKMHGIYTLLEAASLRAKDLHTDIEGLINISGIH